MTPHLDCIRSAQGMLRIDGYRLVSGMRLNALDWLNFFLADVRGGLGAYVNVFLLTRAQWSQAAIGAVLASSGLIGIMAHPAVGAFIDRTRAKRALIIAGAFVLSAAASRSCGCRSFPSCLSRTSSWLSSAVSLRQLSPR